MRTKELSPIKKTVPDKITKEKVSPAQIEGLLVTELLNRLGRPEKLNFIKASNVFDNKWRVDVWCYFDSTETIMATQSCKILHSYFIHADAYGKIIESSPEITKIYK
jgi:hypothetical protein|tara:strand:+ start:4389 stop:4709 length:321 start_codon:yes stop_codon:yes gene_type:complete